MKRNDVGKKRGLCLMANVFMSCAFLLMMVCGSAQAGGLYLNEYMTPSMGTAGAGSAAWA